MSIPTEESRLMQGSRISHRAMHYIVGTRLLQRNTRRVELTDAGREFYAHCVKVVEQAQAANLAMQNRATDAVGTITMSVTVAVADTDRQSE